MKKSIMSKYFCNSIFEISMAGLFIALWTVSAAYIQINFGPMRAGIYLAFAILTGLIFKPIMAFFIAIVADNLQLILSGGTWSWLFALLPIIIILATQIIKIIFKIKSNKIWFLTTFIGVLLILGSILTILLLNQNFIKKDQGKILDFANSLTKIFVWTAFGLFAAFFIIMHIFFLVNIKDVKSNEKFKKVINISIIVSFVYILASWIVGPIATIIWLNQMGGISGKHGSGTDYYWQMYGPYTIIRIIKAPISLPIHVLIVYGIYNVYGKLKPKLTKSWN